MGIAILWRAAASPRHKMYVDGDSPARVLVAKQLSVNGGQLTQPNISSTGRGDVEMIYKSLCQPGLIHAQDHLSTRLKPQPKSRQYLHLGAQVIDHHINIAFCCHPVGDHRHGVRDIKRVLPPPATKISDRKIRPTASEHAQGRRGRSLDESLDSCVDYVRSRGIYQMGQYAW
jgi:hypothetical protein